MKSYCKVVVRGCKVVLKGDQEFVKEVLRDHLSELLHECAKERNYDEEAKEPTPVVQDAGPVSGGSIPTIAELRSKAGVQNNKELVTLVVYYCDHYRQESPTNEDLRRVLKEDLREKTSTINSLTTYLQRAKKEGWVAQEGKRWRLTGTGLQKVHEWLEEQR
ncbi:hypothetical protein V3F56_09170 [Moorellaceae bacterium AZ2]